MLTRTEFQDKLFNLIIEYSSVSKDFLRQSLAENRSLSSIGIDSLDYLELQNLIEEVLFNEFRGDFPEDAFDNLENLGDLESAIWKIYTEGGDCVEEKLCQKSQSSESQGCQTPQRKQTDEEGEVV